jgi:hypothetical protein
MYIFTFIVLQEKLVCLEGGEVKHKNYVLASFLYLVEQNVIEMSFVITEQILTLYTENIDL